MDRVSATDFTLNDGLFADCDIATLDVVPEGAVLQLLRVRQGLIPHPPERVMNCVWRK